MDLVFGELMHVDVMFDQRQKLGQNVDAKTDAAPHKLDLFIGDPMHVDVYERIDKTYPNVYGVHHLDLLIGEPIRVDVY